MDSSLKVVFFGTPSFVVPVGKVLSKTFTLVGVVTAPDAIQGRKKLLTPSPVKEFAQELSLPALTFDVLSHDAQQQIAVLNADLFVVAAYGIIIPQTILDLPRYGAINIHPSLLPKYRGASPIQSALLNGDEISGVTVIKMDEQVDHGPIIAQWEIPLTHQDTFEKLHVSMFEDAANRLPEIIKRFIDNSLQPLPQDDTMATFCDRITREAGYFDSNNPPSPEELDRMIRAYYPWPNAWTRIKTKTNEEKIMKLLPEQKIQLEGGKPMPIKDILNGYPELKELLVKLFEEKNS